MNSTDLTYGLSLSLDGDDTAWVSGYRDVSGDNKLVIAAVDENGVMYTDFSSNGKETFTYTSSASEDDVAQIIKLQVGANTGKYAVAGIANDGSNDHLIVGRLTTAGVLDTSFSGDGKQQIKAATSTLVSGILEQNDGKIIVYGTMTEASVTDGFIARLNTNGSLDTSFATNGIYKTTGITADHISLTKAAIGTSQNIVAVGTLDDGVSNSFIMRVNVSGNLDSASFNASLGYVTGAAGDSYNDLVIDASNNIYVAGERLASDSDFLIQKYNGSGVLVTGFNATGTKVVDINASVSETLAKVLLDTSGNLYLVGNEPLTPNQIAVVKMSATGVLDTGFSGDGITSLIMAPSSNNAMVYDAALDSTGRILVAGYSIVSGVKEAMFGRIKTDGSLDANFGTAAGAGHYQATTCALDEQFNSMVLMDDITAIVAGKCNTSTELNNIGFSKYGFWEDGVAQ
jgi:large repetitive protein